MKVMLVKDVPLNGCYRRARETVNIPDGLAKKLIANKVAVKAGAEAPKDEQTEAIKSIHAPEDGSVQGGVVLENDTPEGMREYLDAKNIEYPPDADEAELRELVESLEPEDDVLE